MTEQESYLSKDHQRLLNYAVWCKYLAWIVLLIFAVGAVFIFIGQLSVWNSTTAARTMTFLQMLGQNPTLAIGLLFGSLRTLFQGVVYFLVLKGISLGLRMIAETDVNYRDRREAAR